MRSLFITNFFPPANRGGYELWCQEVAEGLRARHHNVAVLTSRYGNRQAKEKDISWIHRNLHLEMEITSLRNSFQFFTARKAHENDNLSLLRRQVDSFKPDCILIWGMWNLPRSLPALAEQLMPGKVAYYIGDYWPTLPSQFEFYWKAPARYWVIGPPKKLLRLIANRILERETQPVLCFEHVIFPTKFLRDELKRKNIEPKNTKIIYGAIDTSTYSRINGMLNLQRGEYISLLYAGRLTSEKGVHIAVEAMGKLVNQHGVKKLRLSIVGSGDTAYVNKLHSIIKREKIESYVIFEGAKPKEEMPKIYHQADIFLFTSIWPEPFGRVIVEAMASGLAVVGTATGGAAEILINNENSLVIPANDPDILADKIKLLIDSHAMLKKLALIGKKQAIEKFDIKRMVVEIEEYLLKL